MLLSAAAYCAAGGSLVPAEEPGRAVIGHEQDDRVFVQSRLFQVVEHPADVVVHVVDRTGIDLHAAGMDSPCLIAQFIPGGDGRRPFAQPGAGREQSQIDHAGQAHFPQNVVTVVVPSLIEVDMRLRRLHGNVRSGEIQVGEKGAVLIRVAAQVLDDPVRVEIAGEETLRHGHPGDLHPVLEIAVRHIVPPVQVEVAVGRTASGLGEGPVETPRDREFVRRITQVPLAGGVGPVAVVPQQPGEGHHAVAEHAFISRHSFLVRALQSRAHRSQARQVTVRAGQQHGARGRAVHLGVEAREPDPLLCQAIQCGRIDFAAIGPQFGHADIVGDDDQEVGPAGLGRQRRGHQEAEKQDRSDHLGASGIS